MATCDLTGRKTIFGRNIRHKASGGWARRAPRTSRTFRPNIHRHILYVPEIGRSITLNLSAKALRIINKKGLLAAVRDQGLSVEAFLKEHER
ncbi:MAG: 50S ribosomal protein L28 [Chloroflexi bacterium]|nr:50S ribosomal protein L28 [Chloroflexota bacterium]